MANARLGWFSPLGVAASIRASAGRVGLRVHCFHFSACTDSEWPLGELAFGLTASAFRHAPLRSGHWASWPSGSRLPLFGTHRFGVALGGLAFGLTASAFRHAPLRSGRWASWFFRLLLRRFRSAGWPSGSLLPLFGTHRFGDSAGRVRSSAFRFGDCRSVGWPSGSPLPLFGMRRSAPPHRRREGRRSTPTRHLFHFKTLIPTC